LDAFAEDILRVLSKNMYQYHEMYGKYYIERIYDKNTILDKAEAEAIFSECTIRGVITITVVNH